jgi:2'-hydroxyisoflavone reductase
MLGGTVFLGRHLVNSALARGHTVTIFTRGMHDADHLPAVERLRGNRDGDLAALEGRRWDAAIDTSGFVPRIVRASAELLAGSVEHYTFVSSISVFRDFRARGMDETAPVATLSDPSVEEVTGDTYGALKALCERAAEAAMLGRVLNVRPGLIVGPYDPTDRFTYWPHRVARGSIVLAPGRPGRQIQFIDARDLADWIVRMVEARRVGTYNATGPAVPLAMETLLDVCRAASGSEATFTWASDEFLLEQAVGPWIELPLWIPESDAEFAGHSAINCGKAIDASLTFRSLAETVRDTLAWDRTRPPDYAWKAGLTPEREAALLAAFA